MSMAIETLKKNLLGLWMLQDESLGKQLQREFFDHPMVTEILKYDYRFAENAIVCEKRKLLSDILNSVRRKQDEREKFLERRRELTRRSYSCLVCETEVIGLSCLCRAA